MYKVFRCKVVCVLAFSFLIMSQPSTLGHCFLWVYRCDYNENQLDLTHRKAQAIYCQCTKLKMNTLYILCKNWGNIVSEILSSSHAPRFNNMAGSKHDLIVEYACREMSCRPAPVLSCLNATQSPHSETDKRWQRNRKVLKWNISHLRKHEPPPASYAWALDFNLIVNDAGSSQLSRSGYFLLKQNVRLGGQKWKKNNKIEFVHKFHHPICQGLLQLFGCVNTRITEANQTRFIWIARRWIYFCHSCLQPLMSNA